MCSVIKSIPGLKVDKISSSDLISLIFIIGEVTDSYLVLTEVEKILDRGLVT